MHMELLNGGSEIPRLVIFLAAGAAKTLDKRASIEWYLKEWIGTEFSGLGIPTPRIPKRYFCNCLLTILWSSGRLL